MSYEIYTKDRVSMKKPRVSIFKQGTLNLNQSCYCEYFQSFTYVHLLFDREKRKIGIEPTNVEDNDTYRIRVYRNKTFAQISAKGFLKHFEIQYDKTRPYNCKWNQKDQILEIQI